MPIVKQMGDATNLVLILGGELLKKAENLLVMGLHPSEVIKGYELASAKAQAELESKFSFLTHTPRTAISITLPTQNPAKNQSWLEASQVPHLSSFLLPFSLKCSNSCGIWRTALYGEPRYMTAS